MKHTILLLLFSVMISGALVAQESESPTPQEWLIGKWTNESKRVYEFTADLKVLVNDKDYATYRFLEGTLVLTYILDAGVDVEAGLEFESDSRMELTEYRGMGEKETTRRFKRQE